MVFLENQEPNNKTDFFNKNKKTIIIGVSIIVAIAVIVTTYTATVSSKVKSWNDKIYPGVHAYGVDIGGKTKEEAIGILNDQLTSLIHDKSITVNVGDKSFTLKYSDMNSTINAEKSVEEALAYGKDQTMLNKNSMIKKGVEYSVDTELSYDEEKLKEFENNIYNQVVTNPVDATISISYGNIQVTPEVVGKEIDTEALHNKLVQSINPDPTKTETITVDLQEKAPAKTAAELGKIDGVIASFTGGYNNTADGRVVNMQLATDFINGTLLMPGEEFSYNKTIGDTTPERGYQKANTYVGSEVVPGYGGGVCQISTTLYRAIMRANLRSTIRYNHSMMVAYAEASLDATVAEGDIDYRFINTYDFPVYIEGIMTGSAITFNVYGNIAGMGGKSYDMVNEIIEKYDFETRYIDDATLPEGTNKTKVNGAPGYKSKGYLITYQDGVEVDRELISTDVYQPMDTIIQRGTKKADKPAQ